MRRAAGDGVRPRGGRATPGGDARGGHRSPRARAARATARLVATIATLAIAAGAGWARTAGAAEQAIRLGGIDSVVWTPGPDAPKPWPVVAFSHGIYLCPTQARFLTEALAQAGYLVVAPNHEDSNCDDRGLSLPSASQLAIKPPFLWTDRDYRNRGDDVKTVLAALFADEAFRGAADASRVALAGHSLGGYTVLGLAGAWPSWTLAGTKAVLAMAPYSSPYSRTDGLRGLRIPVMYQAGADDLVFTPPLTGSGGGYAQSPSPKFYVEIAGAGHFAWTDERLAGRDAIVGYALAFLDRYVKGAPASALLREKGGGVSAFLADP